MNAELTFLFEEVFGHPGNTLSDDEKFNNLQKAAYELGDGELINKLRNLKDSQEVALSSETALSFEDSLLFSQKV